MGSKDWASSNMDIVVETFMALSGESVDLEWERRLICMESSVYLSRIPG